MRGDLDLSGMDLADVNLNIKVMGSLDLTGAKNMNLHPKLDFSGTRAVDLSNTDLSGAREIKRSDKNTWPEHLRKSYDLWRAKMLVQNRLKEIAQPNIPGRDISNEY